MSFNWELVRRLSIEPLTKSWESIRNSLPRIWNALLILLVGWALAKILQKLIAKLLRALGIDIISEKLGISAFLKRGGLDERLSRLVGLGIYWLIIFTSLMMALDALGLEPALHLLRDIIYHIPRVIVALILILLGIFLGNFSHRLIESSALAVKIPFAFLLGEITRYGIIAFASFAALGELGVPTPIITMSFAVLLGIIPLTFAIALGIGIRELVANIAASFIIRRSYQVGDEVEVDNYRGEIKSLELLSVSLNTSQGLIAIPNSTFLNRIVIRKSGTEKNLSTRNPTF